MRAKNVIIGVVTLTLIVPAASPFSLLMSSSVAAQVAAPGNPYTDCNYERPLAVQLARGLFGLDDRIARTQRWLDGATRSAGFQEGEAQRMVTSARNDMATDVGFMTLKADAVKAALKSIPASPSTSAVRDLLFKDLEHLEFLNNLVKAALAVGNFQVAKQEAARMANHVSTMEMATLASRALTDAGVTAMLAGKLGGPLAELGLSAGVIAIDAIEATWAANITANEIADAKQTLEILKDQKSKILDRVERVVAACGRENQSTQERPAESPRPISTADMAPPPPENTSGNGGNAASSGGGMAGTIAGVTAAGVGTGVGLYYLNEYQKKAQCDQHETELETRVNNVVTAANNLTSCGSNISCINSRESALNSASTAMLTTAGNWCNCLGPSATSDIPAADKAMLRDLLNQLRGLGIGSGTLPACFR